MPENESGERHTVVGEGTIITTKSDLRKKLNYMIDVFAKDYFAVLVIDFSQDRVEVSRSSEPFVPLLSQTLSKSNTYRGFLDFYCSQYINDQDRTVLWTQLQVEEICRRLVDSGTYTVTAHHMYQGRTCPSEITIIDVSDAQDGSECILAARFLEDIVRQQTALKKQDDMVRTLVQDYNAIYHIDLDADTFIILQAHDVVNEDQYDYAYRSLPFQTAMRKFIEDMVREEDREIMLQISSCDYIKERLKRQEGYSYRFQVKPLRGMQYFEMRIIRARTDSVGHYAIMTSRNVDEAAQAELRAQREIEKANRELEAALSAARKANESKSDFIANVSHDMRTPLNAILGYDRLALESDSDEVRVDYLRKIGEAGNTLLTLINDTLDLQKIENGVTKLHLQPVNCQTITEGIMTAVQPMMDVKHIHFAFDNINSICTTIRADAVRVEEIFINLLSNAVKFTPANGEVLLLMECEKETKRELRLKLTVKDNGVGISPTFIPKIYEPFSQERTEKTVGIGGFGLGLSIVKRLIDLMHGRIEVQSELGKGTIFTVYLSFNKVKKRIAEAQTVSVDLTLLKGKTVLLCEDNEMNREIATAILEQSGMIVIPAANGEEGVNHFIESGSGMISAVLMDIRMPVMDGYAASRAIRVSNHPEARTIPIIALSADAYTDDVKKVQACGMNRHLSKPIDRKLLLQTLQVEIQSRQRQQNKR
ncbi:MAG: ATP-binding protein [Selenomonas sp.]|nr:ATP-binding protein [Selenomonas sp.]